MTQGEPGPAADETSTQPSATPEPGADPNPSPEVASAITYEIPAPATPAHGMQFSAPEPFAAPDPTDGPLLPSGRRKTGRWTIAMLSGLVVVLVCGAIGVFMALSARDAEPDRTAARAPSGTAAPRGDDGQSNRPDGGVHTVNGHQFAFGLIVRASDSQLTLQLRGGKTLTVTTTKATTVDGAAGVAMSDLLAVDQPVVIVGTVARDKTFSATAIFVNERPTFDTGSPGGQDGGGSDGGSGGGGPGGGNTPPPSGASV